MAAALVAVMGCGGKKADSTAGSGSGSGSATATAPATGSGSAAGPGSATAAGSGSGSAVDDGKAPAERTRELLEAQIAALTAGKNDVLLAMFAPDAVVLAPDAQPVGPKLDLVGRIGGAATLGKVEAGDAPGAIWLTAELDVTGKDGQHHQVRAVELLDGARGWKIAAASFAKLEAPAASGTASAIPAPTEAGPLSALLGAPNKLAGALLEEEEGPEVFLAGLEPADRAVGYVDAKLYAYKLGKQGVVLAPGQVREVHTAAWGYAIANLGPKRMTGLVIALPPKDGGAWRVVGGAFAPVADAAAAPAAGGGADASYTKTAFLADPLCKQVAKKIVECADAPEFATALDDGATAAQKKINARLRKGIADWQSPMELCNNAWGLLNYEYSGFLDSPGVFKAANALASCGELGAAVKAGGGLVGGKTGG